MDELLMLSAYIPWVRHHIETLLAGRCDVGCMPWRSARLSQPVSTLGQGVVVQVANEN